MASSETPSRCLSWTKRLESENRPGAICGPDASISRRSPRFYELAPVNRFLAKTPAVAILVVGFLTTAMASCNGSRPVARCSFWFDDGAFNLPSIHAERIGGPIDDFERAEIESIARTELRAAFLGLRVMFSADRDAFYRVRVVNDLGSGAAGQSHVLPPLGGQGAVSFRVLAGRAIAYAPPGSDRATVIEAIGRGVGRAAVHEFAHQMLRGLNIHASSDDLSYEYASADRSAQYYGSLRWDAAWPALVETWGE
jgi:hypothetical protein